jgi:hypothetical protein
VATDTLKASIPELQLAQKVQLVWEAVDPTTGAQVANVKVSLIGVYGPNLGDAAVGTFGPFNPVLLRTSAAGV